MNEKLYKANVELSDRNTLLEEDVKILKRRIEHAIKYIEQTKEYYHDGVNEELIEILKGEVLLSE